MCGIAGIMTFGDVKVSQHKLKDMTDVISHRGPDGEGFWMNSQKNVGLGHRRLAIIDLSINGKQPMNYSDENYTITFNGEIYNYLELKEQLKTQGYKFNTETDTEVILALYDLKREKCLDDLDGMFAFAIWNEKEQEMFCARDRFGEKPFHYFVDNNQFVFGSEIKQFWAYGIDKEILPDRLDSFLKNGQIDDPNDVCETFYKGIKRLDAGHYMRVFANGNYTISQYWSLDENKKIFAGSMEEATAVFFELLKKSVRLRLRSDVPVGTSLSGGLDSSSIIMLIDQLKGGQQKQTSFSARFIDFDKDEGKHMEEVINACQNIEANYIWPDADFFYKNLNDINFHQDEPYGSASIVAQYAVMQLAKEKNVTVLIDGQGADEYLAGYLPYYKLYLDSLFYHNNKKHLSEVKAYNALHAQTRPYLPPNHNESLRMKTGRLKRKLLGQKMPYDESALRNQLVADTTSSGLKTLLRYADRNSMAHSREVRLPFLSHELVEFVFSLPDDFKLKEGWTKYILRKSMDGILPKSICWRVDKIGYAAPQMKWLQNEAVKEIIEKSALNFQLSSEVLKSGLMDDSIAWRVLIADYYSNK